MYKYRWPVFLVLLISAPALSQQQDPIVSVQLKSTQWDALRKLLVHQNIDEYGDIYYEIQGQLTRQYQGFVQNQSNALEKAVRDKIAKEAKEKADADAKANAAAPPPDQPKE